MQYLWFKILTETVFWSKDPINFGSFFINSKKVIIDIYVQQ